MQPRPAALKRYPICSIPSRKKATAPEMTGVAHSYTCQIATGRHSSQIIKKRDVCLHSQLSLQSICWNNAAVGYMKERNVCLHSQLLLQPIYWIQIAEDSVVGYIKKRDVCLHSQLSFSANVSFNQIQQ